MVITGIPKSLNDRSFNFASPYFSDLAFYYWGGDNINLLTGTRGTEFNDDGVPTFAYVDQPINNVADGKAISPATNRSTIVFPVKANPLTNDLNGIYSDFTILFWGKLIVGGTYFSLPHGTLDEYIRLGSFATLVDPVGSGMNLTFTVRGSLEVEFTMFGGGIGVNSEFRLYGFKRQGNTYSVGIEGLWFAGEVRPDVGVINNDGRALLGRRNLEFFDNSRALSDTSLVQVYKRALTQIEFAALHVNPFIALPDPSGVILPPPPDGFVKTSRVYFIGNSVTDTVSYNRLKAISNTNNRQLIYGRQVIPGAPLEWLRDHPLDGFVEFPFNHPGNALVNYDWDCISLQPFDRGLADDIDDAGYFLNLLYSRVGNLNTRVLIYSRWARQENESLPYDIQTLWNRSYLVSNESKDYFERVLLGVRLAYPTKAVDIVPVGDALLLLDTEAKAGRVPGIATAKDLFADGIHFTDIGQYFVGMVFYATIYRENPENLGFVGYAGMNQPLADKLQSIAWDTVDMHPYSGVDSSLVIDPNPPLIPGIPFGCIPDYCECGAMPCVEHQAGRIFDRLVGVEVDGKTLTLGQGGSLTVTLRNGNITTATFNSEIIAPGLMRLRLTAAQTQALTGLYSWRGVIVNGAVSTTINPGEFWIRGD